MGRLEFTSDRAVERSAGRSPRLANVPTSGQIELFPHDRLRRPACIRQIDSCDRAQAHHQNPAYSRTDRRGGSFSAVAGMRCPKKRRPQDARRSRRLRNAVAPVRGGRGGTPHLRSLQWAKGQAASKLAIFRAGAGSPSRYRRRWHGAARSPTRTRCARAALTHLLGQLAQRRKPLQRLHFSRPASGPRPACCVLTAAARATSRRRSRHPVFSSMSFLRSQQN